MGYIFTKLPTATKIESTSGGYMIVTSGDVKITVYEESKLRFEQLQGFGTLLNIDKSEIDLIDGAPPDSNMGDLLDQLSAVFTNASSAAAGAIKSINGELPDSNGDIVLTAAELGVVAANPTASVGLTAFNGTAETFMRSDAAPPLSPAIEPQWSAMHTFIFAASQANPTVRVGGLNPQLEIYVPNGAADAKRWNWSTTSNNLTFRALNDNGNAASNIWNITRAAGAVTLQEWAAGGANRMALSATGWQTLVPGSFVTGADGNKLWLAKFSSGTGHNNAPTTLGAASTYMYVGGREYGNNGFGGIGFGYVADTTQNPAVWVGYEEKVTSGNTNGDFLVATRPSTTNVGPTERFRITAAGDLVTPPAYTAATAQSLTTKKDAQDVFSLNLRAIPVPHTTAGPVNLVDADPTLHLFDATAGNIDVTISGTANKVFILKRIDGSANTVTITPTSGTIEGQANWSPGQWAFSWLMFDGTNWIEIGN